MHRKVLLITRKHREKDVDNVSVSPSDCQSEAICSVLEGKSGKLLQQELSSQINSVFEAEGPIADPDKWLADRRALPVNWGENGDLYSRIFKQDDMGSFIDQLLGRLFLNSPPTRNTEDNRRWFKAELEKMNGLKSKRISVDPVLYRAYDFPVP